MSRFLWLLLALVAAMLVSVFIGAERLAVADVWQSLLSGPNGGDSIGTIVWQLRLPRILAAAACGWMLAAAGVGFQGVLRNPLADPYITGVAGGAAVGASCAVLFGFATALGGFAAPVAAFVFAFGGALLVFGLVRRAGRMNVASFLLAGIAIGSMLWAIITLLLLVAHQPFERILYWLMGSFQQATWETLSVMAIVGGVGVLGLWRLARPLDVYALGEESAAHLGVDVERVKRGALLFGSLATAAAVSFFGIIGFVGLIVPHLARRMFSPRHALLFPSAGLMGAILLVLADTLARSALPPTEIPVGVLTALVGGPFLVAIVRKGTLAA